MTVSPRGRGRWSTWGVTTALVVASLDLAVVPATAVDGPGTGYDLTIRTTEARQLGLTLAVEVVGPDGYDVVSAATANDPAVVHATAPAGSYTATVTSPFYEPSSTTFEVGPGVRTGVPVALVSRYGAAALTVRYSDGSPAAGVRFHVRGDTRWTDGAGVLSYVFATPGPADFVGPDGTATTLQLTAGELTRADVELAVGPPGSIRLAFSHLGDSPPPVDVSLYRVTDGVAQHDSALDASFSGTAPAAISVPPGTYVVWLDPRFSEDRALPSVRRTVVVASGATVDLGTVDFTPAWVSGFVRGASFEPDPSVVAWAVEVSCTTGAELPAPRDEVGIWQGNDGAFRFGGMPGSCYDLHGQPSRAADDPAVPVRRVPAGASGVQLHPRLVTEPGLSSRAVAYGSGRTVTVSVAIPAPTRTADTIPRGTARVRLGATTLGPVTLGSRGTAGLAVPRTLRPGRHAVTVVYDGSTLFQPSSARATITVAKAPAAVKVKASHAVEHRRATLKVTVSAKLAASGKVTATVGGLSVGHATLHKVHGVYTATIRTSVLPARGKLVVVYGGNHDVARTTHTVARL